MDLFFPIFAMISLFRSLPWTQRLILLLVIAINFAGVYQILWWLGWPGHQDLILFSFMGLVAEGHAILSLLGKIMISLSEKRYDTVQHILKNCKVIPLDASDETNDVLRLLKKEL